MDAAAKMELFQNLFYVSAALAVIGLGLAIFFFFYFDIRYIYLIISGKDKRDAVEQMNQRSARNGRLRRMNKHAAKPAPQPQVPVYANVPAGPDQQMTVPLNQTQPGQTAQAARVYVEETTLLVEQTPAETMRTNTAVMRQEQVGETEILSEQMSDVVQVPANFVLTENTILIHTNEII